MAHIINWFEIPVLDLKRAVTFYSGVFSIKMEELDLGPVKMATFPMDMVSVSGALVQGEFYTPTEGGPVLYLNCGEDLNVQLAKIEAAGGKIIIPKKQISEEYGYMALFIDSEGNRLALHSHH